MHSHKCSGVEVGRSITFPEAENSSDEKEGASEGASEGAMDSIRKDDEFRRLRVGLAVAGAGSLAVDAPKSNSGTSDDDTVEVLGSGPAVRFCIGAG